MYFLPSKKISPRRKDNEKMRRRNIKRERRERRKLMEEVEGLFDPKRRNEFDSSFLFPPIPIKV